jgi:hypothetical protein
MSLNNSLSEPHNNREKLTDDSAILPLVLRRQYWQRMKMDNRLKSYDVQQQRQARRAVQRRSFFRRQAVGLLIAAAVVLAYRIFHTPSGWLFPQGWWRLW